MPILPPFEYLVSSGQTSSGLTEDVRHYEVVLSGGTASANQVSAGGHVYVSLGGVTRTDHVFSGGVELLSAGGSAFTPTIYAGGVMDGGGVIFGGADYGLLSGVTVESGGRIAFPTAVDSGGSASAVTIAGGGTLDIEVGGIANSTTVLNGYFDLVSSAREAFARVSGANAHMDVAATCSAYADIVIGGAMTVEGEADFAFAASGGTITVADGLVSGAQVAAGGTLLDTFGLTSDTEVEAGGVLSVGSPATDEDAVVSAGGQLYVAGVSTGADIQAGGVVSITQVNGIDVGAYVLGQISGAHVESGALLALADTLSPYVYGGAGRSPVVGTIFDSSSVLSAASLDFRSSFMDTGVLSGQVNLLGAGDTFSGATLEIGQATVEAGATFTLFDAAAGSVTVSSGGVALLDGLDTDAFVGSATVSSGGVVLMHGDDLTVGGATVLAGGLLSVSGFGGVLEGQTNVYGVVRSVNMGVDGAVMTVESGGLADSVGMGPESNLMAVLSGGSAVSTYVVFGDTLTVASGGVVSGTEIGGSGATAYIYGSAVNTSVSERGAPGGSGDLSVSGAATGVVVGDGGTVEDYGAASDVRVFNGGLFTLNSLTPAATVTAGAGATVKIDSGEIVYSTGRRFLAGTLEGGGSLIEDGPGTLVMRGVTTGFVGDIVLSAGVVELARKGEVSNDGIVFETSSKTAVLRIDAADRPANGARFGPTFYDFDSSLDHIDLAGLAFSSGATATLSKGVLTLVDGGYSAKFKLSGTVANHYVVGADGAGGAFIRAATSAPASAPTVASHQAETRFTQAIAGFESGRATDLAAIHSGGTMLGAASALVTTAMSGR